MDIVDNRTKSASVFAQTDEMLHPLSPDTDDYSIENSLNGVGSGESPQEFSCYMTEEDFKGFQQCLVDFYCKALFPFVERQARSLNEAVRLFLCTLKS